MIRAKLRPSWTTLAVLLILAATTDAAVKRTRKRVVCYYTNWSVYRQGLAKYQPANINPHLCTHLIYAFGTFNDDFQLTPADKYQDIEKGGYARFNGLKQYNKGLRTLLAIGGWNEGSGRFSEMVADPEYRKTFILSVIRYLRLYHFDGLDLDWEYPGSRSGSTYEDKDNYATLCEELRAAFDAESLLTNRPGLLLTVAVPAGIETIEKGFNVPRLNAAVDFFNILAYDYHASTEPLTDHHAPLLPPPGTFALDTRGQLNVDYTVRFYLKLGAERRKLVVGIPTYGRSYTLIDERFNGLQAAAQKAGSKGKSTKEEGYLSFYEICERVAVDQWKVYRPYPEAMGPYATKGTQWVGYDDEFVVKKKAEYVRDNYLGGIMFWSIDNDDFRGRCSGRPYPLIEAAKDAYLAPAPGAPPKQAAAPTPVPPATPDPGAEFICKREGFFPHPTECNKYFWCLSGGPLGIVSHSFTCPDGLLFNRQTDSCDFPRNVRCKVEVKEVESITFPPTQEPTVLPLSSLETTGDVTPDPFDQFYEDYDTESLPPLDLDLPAGGQGQAAPTVTAAVPDRTEQAVLGGSRGAETRGQEAQQQQEQEQEQESDPEELRKLLKLIEDLGGVEAVQQILEEGSTGPEAAAISERDRSTLIQIVGLRRTTTASPRYTPLTTEKPSARPEATPSSAPKTRQQESKIIRLHVSRGRRPQVTTEVIPDAAEVTEVNSRRRRPQYSSIQRDRVATTAEAAAATDDVTDVTSASAGRRQYVTLQRQRPTRPTSVEEGNTTQEPSGTQSVILRQSEPTEPTPSEPTTPAIETSVTQTTDEVEPESAAAVGASEGGAGRPRDGTSDVTETSAPSDTAGVQTLLDLTDAAANSLEPEPKQRRIRIRLRRPSDRSRDQTEATTTAAIATQAAETTEASVEESASTVAPVEAPTEVLVEEIVDGVAEAPTDEAESTSGEEDESTSDKDQRKIRVIRLKRPREQTTVLPTESAFELRDNEVTVDGLDTAETTVQSDVEESGAVPATQLDSAPLEPKPEETTLPSKTADVQSRERVNALFGNALPLEEGIRGRALEEQSDPGRPVGEPDFTLRNTLRRLAFRRRGNPQALSASQSEEDEQVKAIRGAVRNRPRSELRRQRTRPIPEIPEETATLPGEKQNPGEDEARERPPLRGIRLINLRDRGLVLRGRSSGGSTSNNPSGTTQIVTDVQAATEPSDVILLTDTATEQPDVTKVTVTESVTVVSESATEASSVENNPEALEPAELTELTAKRLNEEAAPVEEKQVTDSVRRPLRRGLIRRLKTEKSNDPGDPTTSDVNRQVVTRDRTTLRRLNTGNRRNTVQRGTVRRRFRQRNGLRRRRPGQQTVLVTTENPEVGVEDITVRAVSDSRQSDTEESSKIGENAITNSEPDPTENSLETSKAIVEESDVVTESALLIGDGDSSTTTVYLEDGTTTSTNDITAEELITEPAISTQDPNVQPVISISGESGEPLDKDEPVLVTQPDSELDEAEQAAADNATLPVFTSPIDPEESLVNSTPTVTAQYSTTVANEEEAASTTALPNGDNFDGEATTSPSLEQVTQPGRRPPIRGLFRLRQRGEEAPSAELNTESESNQLSALRRDRPRTGLRNRLRSQQQQEASITSSEKEAEPELPASTREGLLSQSSLGLDAERTRQEENNAESGSISQEGLLRRVRPAGDRETALEQLTESGKNRPLRVQGGTLRLRRPTSEVDNVTEATVTPGKGDEIQQDETGKETGDSFQAITELPVEESTIITVSSPEESPEDVTESAVPESTTSVGTTLQNITDETSKTASKTLISQDDAFGDEVLAEIPVAQTFETATATNTETTTDKSVPTRGLFSRVRNRQGNAPASGRDSISISDRLALLRASIGNSNTSPLTTVATTPSTISDRLALLRTSLGNSNTSPPSTSSSTISSATTSPVPSTTEQTVDTAVERLQRLRQSLLAGRRERPDSLAGLRRRPSPLSLGRRPFQRPIQPGSSEAITEATVSLVIPSDSKTTSSLATEATVVPTTETATEPSLQTSFEETQLDDNAGGDVPSQIREVPFRRKFSGQRQRPFPIRPSSERRGSLGSRLRERLSATASLANAPGAENGNDKTDSDVTTDRAVVSTTPRPPSSLLLGRSRSDLTSTENEENDGTSSVVESDTFAPRRSLFQPPRRSSPPTGIAERLKERLSRRPGFSSANQGTSDVTDAATTQTATVPTESAETTNSDAKDAIFSQSLSSFRRTRRPVAGGSLRNSLRQRLAGLSSRANVEPSPIPAPKPSSNTVSDTPASDITTDDPQAAITQEFSENTSTESQEDTTEASESKQTTTSSDNQEENLSSTQRSEDALEQPNTDLSAQSETPTFKDGLRNSLRTENADSFDEASQPLADSSNEDIRTRADVESSPITTTERTASTRRSALLRFSSHSRKPSPEFKGAVPSSVQNERANNDLAAKLASKSNTESPLSALRNRLRERLAASIGLTSSSGLKTQADNASSNNEDSNEAATSGTSSIAPSDRPPLLFRAHDGSQTTESQVELSNTESPEQFSTVPQEIPVTLPGVKASVLDAITTTEAGVSDVAIENTTDSDLPEAITTTNTESEIQETGPNTSTQEEETSEAPITTAATTVSILQATARPRKLSLVQQLRQRQEQKKSSVKSLVEQLRSSLFGGQNTASGKTTTTTTTTSEPITDTVADQITEAVPEESAGETTTLFVADTTTPTVETTTLSYLETSTVSFGIPETEYPEITTTNSEVTAATTASPTETTESKIDPSPETRTEPTSVQQQLTTKGPVLDGVVYAVAVDPATYFTSTTESAREESSLPTTTESLSVKDLSDANAFYEEGVVYATTVSDEDAKSVTVNAENQSEPTTIMPSIGLAEGNQHTSTPSSSDNTGVTEEKSDTNPAELFVNPNPTTYTTAISESPVSFDVDSLATQVVPLSSEVTAETTSPSPLLEDGTDAPKRTTILPEVITYNPDNQESTGGVKPTTIQPNTDPEETTLFTRGREGRLLQFEESVSDTAPTFIPPTTAPGFIPTGNPGSFVSVKVSVSSSVEESPATTESLQFIASTEEPTATTQIPAVDALFTMWGHDSETTTVSPTAAGYDEITTQESGTTESEETTRTEDPLTSSTEDTTSATSSDLDLFTVRANTLAPEVQTTATPDEEADVADHALDRPQEASLVNVLHKGASTPVEPKPTLYDSQSLLAFSTVTPRYRDPDSLFKRKTYLRSGGAHQSPVTWMLGVCSLLLLWSRW